MGDRVNLFAFQELADPCAALDAAEQVLRQMDLITGEPDSKSVLGAEGARAYRPGPAAATGYGDEIPSHSANGVAFIGPRYFNGFGLGLAEWFFCPACGGRIGDDHAAFHDQMNALGMAAVRWAQGSDEPEMVGCPLCEVPSAVTNWTSDDPVFLADMCVEFWNWPMLAKPGYPDGCRWKIDVTGALERAVGAPVIISGHKI